MGFASGIAELTERFPMDPHPWVFFVDRLQNAADLELFRGGICPFSKKSEGGGVAVFMRCHRRRFPLRITSIVFFSWPKKIFLLHQRQVVVFFLTDLSLAHMDRSTTAGSYVKTINASKSTQVFVTLAEQIFFFGHGNTVHVIRSGF